MKEIKNVRGCLNPAPLEYGKDTVYVRKNIHTIEVEGETQAEYDVEEYSYAEWAQMQDNAIDDLTVAILEG